MEFWQALGGRARAALNFTVTLAVQVREPVSLGAVAERVILLEMGTGEDGTSDRRPRAVTDRAPSPAYLLTSTRADEQDDHALGLNATASVRIFLVMTR